MDSSVIFFTAAVLIVGGLLFAVITMTKRGVGHLDVDKYRLRWLKIEQQLSRDDAASHRLCVLEADKLVDLALREKGARGQTMGERMKNMKDIWSDRNGIWMAHKLRNQIAHEHDVRMSYDDARRALSGFKRALKDLGAI